MDYRDTQELQSLDPKDYSVVICVFGTRYWNDKVKFHETLSEYLQQFDQPVLFLSGGAPTGADDFIIQWCKRYRFPCLVELAHWTRPDGSTNKAAGFERNETMARTLTHGLGFGMGSHAGLKT